MNILPIALIVGFALLLPGQSAFAASDDDLSGPVVATWSGGQTRATAVEERLSQTSTRKGAAEGGASQVDQLVERYRKAAEQEAVAQLVLANAGDPEAALKSLEVETDFANATQSIVMNAYISDRRAGITVDDDAAKAYYDAHSGQFETPKRVVLWNIYKRDVTDDEAGKSATNEFLNELRQRYLDGEKFGSLAREHSESETRLRDGRVGNYAEGALPEKLADVVFSLEEGGVSEPQRVSDGAVLLHVTGVAERSVFPLKEARSRIESILRTQLLEEEIRTSVADRKLPESSTVLTDEEFEAAVRGDDKEKTVLEIGTFRLSAGQAGQMMGAVPAPVDIEPDDNSDEATARRVSYGYAGLVARAHVYDRIGSEPDLLKPAVREDIDAQLERLRQKLIVDGDVNKRVRKLAESQTEELQRFYEDNAHHFQSELLFEVRHLTAPLGDDAMARMRTLEGLRERLIAGSIDLDAAATELGGEVADLGSLGLAEIGETGSKLPTLVLELGSTGFTVPFQDNDLLQMVHIVKREDPKTLPIDEVRERVLDEYLQRHQRALTGELIEKMLADAKFNFDPDAVRAYVLPPAL
ncbi:MAG: parvulin-like peptidyl-prolyl isomerase [Hyphomicrobiaceae bacterium]|jgi:parvulin-like peptidyl-prolyl isomerase